MCACVVCIIKTFQRCYEHCVQNAKLPTRTTDLFLQAVRSRRLPHQIANAAFNMGDRSVFTSSGTRSGFCRIPRQSEYLYKTVVCDSVCLSFCLFPRISVSFACIGLKLCRRARGPFLPGWGCYVCGRLP